MSIPLSGAIPVSARLAKARAEARRLIELKPWLDRADWEAGRIVYDPNSGAFLNYLMIVICLLIGISALVGLIRAVKFEVVLLVPAVVFLVLGALLIFYRIKSRFGRSECLLRSVPARLGGVFEAEVRVRLRASPVSQVRVTLDHAFGKGAGEVWRAEQLVARDKISIAGDGTWTIPVRIPVPSRVPGKPHGPGEIDDAWNLWVRAETAGPDYEARFEVPVFDLADLPYEEDKGDRERAAEISKYGTLGREITVGVLLGTLLGIPFGMGPGGVPIFSAIFLGSLFAFMLGLPGWRVAVAVAMRDRSLPDRETKMRLRLVLLTLAPWAVAAIVLAIEWNFSLVTELAWYIGLAWGIGMLSCTHPSPFGRVWRDPVFQSGAALTLCSLAMLAFD